MPEGPEVETVRRTLKHFILNEKIRDVKVVYNKIIEDDTDYFIECVKNQTIRDIKRHGKYLIFILDNIAFLSHLRMEGKFNIRNYNEPYNKHDHVIFRLENMELRYNDTRKFGRMKIVPLDNYLNVPPLNKLGKEVKDTTFEDVYERIKNSNLPLKTLLLDQSLFVGIGNIYANEICFKMKIDPRSKASRLSKNRIKELLKISEEVLDEAIKQGGTTIHSFDANGITGLFQVKLNVHTQKTCPICNGDIKKIMIRQRGTYYCPHCQKRRY